MGSVGISFNRICRHNLVLPSAVIEKQNKDTDMNRHTYTVCKVLQYIATGSLGEFHWPLIKGA